MARKPGVTAAQTREQLLDAAARVFAEKGYEGAKVDEIARTAGLSTGAIYAHYENKSDLLLEAIRSHGSKAVDGTVAGESATTVLDALIHGGVGLGSKRHDNPALLLEAVVAGRRDPKLQHVLAGTMKRREDKLTEFVQAGQASGEISPTVRPAGVARLCLLLGLGAAVVNALELDPPESTDWSAVIRGLVNSMKERSTHD